MGLRRKIAVAAGVLAALAVLGGALAWLALPPILGGMLRNALVETARTEFGLRLEAGRTRFNPFTGRFEIADVTVWNPPGFDESQALLLLPELRFTANWRDWHRHRRPSFHALTLDLARLNVERRPDAVSNLDTLIRRLDPHSPYLLGPLPGVAPTPRAAKPILRLELTAGDPAAAPAALALAARAGGADDLRIDRLQLTVRELRICDDTQPFLPDLRLEARRLAREYRGIRGTADLQGRVLGTFLAALARAIQEPGAAAAPPPPPD
ncbi:MAG: hypothetical protein WC789_11045 [Lentisphaeria bacterium]|jgi:hypothetical protein